MCVRYIVLVLLVVRSAMGASKKYFFKDKGDAILEKFVRDCLESDTRLACFAEKTAIAVERSINWDIPLFSGVDLIRKKVKIDQRSGKSLSGFHRLQKAISNFIDTHKLSINFLKLDPVTNGEARGKGGDEGGLFQIDKKDMKKEKKYYRYAFMVLLGIFGLTGPLVIKILSVTAAHALLSAKAALIIVGGVALKKLFEHEEPKKTQIKVHSIPVKESEEEFDRMSYNNYNLPFGHSSSRYNQPYSAYANEEFAPVHYGTPYNNKIVMKNR